MKSTFRAVLTAGAVLAAGSLAACHKDPATEAARDHSGGVAAAAPSTASASGPDRRAEPVAKASDGKPIWSANRQHTARENAEAAFKRNGEAFGAADVDEFIAIAHTFLNHPPKGVQTIARTNGDTELYDPKANVFAVATKDGAPRTIFKPDTGQAYWDQELTKAATRKTTASRRSKAKNQDDEG